MAPGQRDRGHTSYADWFDGHARLTYLGDNHRGGASTFFEVIVFVDGNVVGLLRGYASAVLPGKTETVELSSSDEYVSGTREYAFQRGW